MTLFRVFDYIRKLTEVSGRSTEVDGISRNAKKPAAIRVYSPKALINQGLAAIFEPTKKWRSFLQNEEKMRRKMPDEEKMERKNGRKE